MQFNHGEQVKLLDPALGAPFTTVQLSTVQDVEDAVRQAKAAFGLWSRKSWDERAEILNRAAEAIRSSANQIAPVLTQEQGKPIKEATIEVRRCADTFEIYAQERFRDIVAPREVPGKVAYVRSLPLGVVAAIVPWNFPLTLLANKLVPALAAGNTVVAKPAQTTPLATAMVLERLYEAGLPEGAVTTVLGEAEVGQALVQHPDVPMVSFTGSTQTGRAIMAAAAPRVKRLALELGGSDPLIVDETADVTAAAKAAAIGRFFNAGQACIATKRIFVHDSVADEFIDALAARIDRLPVGDGRTPGVLMGPQHTAAQQRTTLRQIQDAVDRGATVVRGGGKPDDADLADGFFVSPTLVTDVPEDAALMTEECFGPAVPVVRVASLDEAIDRANASEFGLGSAIWTQSKENAAKAVERLQAGYTWVNDIAVDYDAMPFGGVKQSGFGKERGVEVIDEYRVLKSVVNGDGLLEGFADD